MSLIVVVSVIRPTVQSPALQKTKVGRPILGLPCEGQSGVGSLPTLHV